MATNPLQLFGLSSGLDTASIIDQLMSIERRPLTKLQTNQTSIQKRSTVLGELKTRFANLETKLANLNTSGALGARSVSLDTPSSSTAVLTATASPEAAIGTFKVYVDRLATTSSVQSGNPIGQALTANAKLADIGFGLTPTAGTFTINGQAITIDADTKLSDGVDLSGANTIIAKINNSGAGVTASITNDAFGRANKLTLTGSSGTISLGSGADTSNFLTASKLLTANVSGAATAANLTGSPVAAGVIASTNITINGVTTTTTATDPGNSAADNAAILAGDINSTGGGTVTAFANNDGSITLRQNATGASNVIDITDAGTGTGLSAGTVSNGGNSTISSTDGLGVIQTTTTLSNARLQTALSTGSGAFKINGVEIAWNSATDSMNNVISKINSSAAGVTATYDSVADRIKVTSNNTGAISIAMQDTTGNFLASTGVLGASQTLGVNALYRIDLINGGAQQASTSNTVSGVVPGVSLTLKQQSATPVTVSVGSNSDAALMAVRDFVGTYNNAMSYLRSQVSVDPKTKVGGPFAADSTIRDIETRMKTMLTSPGAGLTGAYTKLSDVGISFGVAGSALGATDDLVIDETKFRTALDTNPFGVKQLFSGLSSTASLAAGGTSSVASITGAATGPHSSGKYTVTTAADGTISAFFTPTGGKAGATVTGQIAANGTNATLISGLVITAGASLVAGTSTINVSVTQKGIMVAANDYAKDISADAGMLTTRQTSSDAQLTDMKARIERFNARLTKKEDQLTKQFSRLEQSMSKLKAQGENLTAQLAKLG